MRQLLPCCAALAALLALSACGSQADLRPRAGHQLPVAPYGRTDRPGSGELLGVGSQARPAHNVELHTKSELRADDPFDLPPQD
ncbi:MAG TPA: hypothetical protein VFF98_15210 [Novosphingobium sp.]|nr:hypothetical protein [Novosphingobium sp.]HZV09933.1 hypothetical protein [Novosphingobium sp.]